MPFTKEQIESLGITYEEGMTDESVIAQLQSQRNEHAKIKASFDKASSELASYKKKEKDAMSEDEKTKAHIADLEAKLAESDKKNAIRDIKDQYVGMGYDAKLAERIAVATLDNNYSEVAKCQKEFLDAHDASLKEDIMKNNPKPRQGDPNKADTLYTKENFKAGKIGYEALCKLQAEDPQKYEEITKE